MSAPSDWSRAPLRCSTTAVVQSPSENNLTCQSHPNDFSLNPHQTNRINEIFQRYSKVVCRVDTQNPKESGSGTIILGNLLVTNFHVLQDPQAANNSRVYCRIVTQQNNTQTDTTTRNIELKLDPTDFFFSSENNDVVIKIAMKY